MAMTKDLDGTWRDFDTFADGGPAQIPPRCVRCDLAVHEGACADEIDASPPRMGDPNALGSTFDAVYTVPNATTSPADRLTDSDRDALDAADRRARRRAAMAAGVRVGPRISEDTRRWAQGVVKRALLEVAQIRYANHEEQPGGVVIVHPPHIPGDARVADEHIEHDPIRARPDSMRDCFDIACSCGVDYAIQVEILLDVLGGKTDARNVEFHRAAEVLAEMIPIVRSSLSKAERWEALAAKYGDSVTGRYATDEAQHYREMAERERKKQGS